MPHLKLSRITNDISDLIKLLQKYSFDNFLDVYHLQDLVGKQNISIREHKIDGLTLRVSSSGQTPYPKVSKLAISIKAEYTFKDKLTEDTDIFENYSFEMFIKGYPNPNDADTDEHQFFCWHLDKEIKTDGKFIHPLYHIHAGGKRLEGIVNNENPLVFISSPRIPHPPMDIILIIHFIIQNFVNKSEVETKSKLLKDENYINIIARAEKRVLSPYFRSLNGERHNDYNPENLFPLYTV